MRYVLLLSVLLFSFHNIFSQENSPRVTTMKNGKFYFYWGWNHANYSKSDITFSGDNYKFTLSDVVAKDRQSVFKFDTYFNPVKFTIPQTDFRLGYYIKENWDISFGFDHMKYVMESDQSVNINGYINNTSEKYDGVYSDEPIVLTPDFLKFEHTDGLNYINVEMRHTDPLFDIGKFTLSVKEGLGLGILRPRTNSKLLGNKRNDTFHTAGYGLSAVLGLNVSFLNKFFVQSEIKSGYINMSDVKTTPSDSDKASQSFFFTQYNIVFGGVIDFHRKKKAIIPQ